MVLLFPCVYRVSDVCIRRDSAAVPMVLGSFFTSSATSFTLCPVSVQTHMNSFLGGAVAVDPVDLSFALVLLACSRSLFAAAIVICCWQW